MTQYRLRVTRDMAFFFSALHYLEISNLDIGADTGQTDVQMTAWMLLEGGRHNKVGSGSLPPACGRAFSRVTRVCLSVCLSVCLYFCPRSKTKTA